MRTDEQIAELRRKAKMIGSIKEFLLFPLSRIYTDALVANPQQQFYIPSESEFASMAPHVRHLATHHAQLKDPIQRKSLLDCYYIQIRATHLRYKNLKHGDGESREFVIEAQLGQEAITNLLMVLGISEQSETFMKTMD